MRGRVVHISEVATWNITYSSSTYFFQFQKMFFQITYFWATLFVSNNSQRINNSMDFFRISESIKCECVNLDAEIMHFSFALTTVIDLWNTDWVKSMGKQKTRMEFHNGINRKPATKKSTFKTPAHLMTTTIFTD